MKKSSFSLVSHAGTIGIYAALLYVVCLAWPLLLTDPAAVNLHLLMLKVTFPGFQTMEVGSMIWGGLLSFVYGFIFSMLFHKLHKDCC